MLQISRLTVRYGPTVAVDAVDLTVHRGELTALVGRNGSGKSSLLRAVAGLQRAEGSVALHGREARDSRAAVAMAYVGQRADLRWDLPVCVLETVLAGRHALAPASSRAAARSAAMTALERLGAADLALRQVGTLSAGQAQRVLLARALAQEPDVLLLDEPFTGLDAPSTQSLCEALDRLHCDGVAVLCALHELAIARSVFPRTVALYRRVVDDGPTAQVLGPRGLERVFVEAAA